MVSRLRSPNADLSIELDEGQHQLGKPITGRVTLLPGEGFEMRGAKAEFICTETYWLRVRRTSRFGSAETNEPAATLIREYSHPLFVGSEIANLMPQVGDINFTIPLNAPPTVQGGVANLAWRLIVTVDVARGRDISREIDLIVMPAPGERADNTQPTENAAPALTQFAECDMNLSLTAHRVCMGETVDGVLRVYPKTGRTPQAARVELMRTEAAGTSNADLSIGVVEFQIPGSTGADEAMEFPFSLPVPECLLTTISVHETSVSWRARGTVTVGRGKELDISQRVTVRGSS